MLANNKEKKIKLLDKVNTEKEKTKIDIDLLKDILEYEV